MLYRAGNLKGEEISLLNFAINTLYILLFTQAMYKNCVLLSKNCWQIIHAYNCILDKVNNTTKGNILNSK